VSVFYVREVVMGCDGMGLITCGLHRDGEHPPRHECRGFHLYSALAH
jgi:hypothetical protein